MCAQTMADKPAVFSSPKRDLMPDLTWLLLPLPELLLARGEAVTGGGGRPNLSKRDMLGRVMTPIACCHVVVNPSRIFATVCVSAAVHGPYMP